DFVQVVLVTGCKIIQPDNLLAHEQQGFQQVGADEAGAASNQPCLGLCLQTGRDFLIACRHEIFLPYSRKSVSSAASTYFRSYSTCSALPKARMAWAPMATNCSCDTARIMPS